VVGKCLVKMFPDQLISGHTQKISPKGATWDLLISKNYFKKSAANEAFQIVDNSRLSTDIIAPFF